MILDGTGPTISVIIPTLNEAEYVGHCLSSVAEALPDAQVLVIDGGSTDATVSQAAKAGVHVSSSVKGRGSQCNAGGQIASGDLLLFLHADTALPPDAHEMIIAEFSNRNTNVVMFRLSFDVEHPLLKFYSFFTRFDSPWFKFGDQALIVRREFFNAIGGFPEWPLFEDVEFLRKARVKTSIHILPSAVISSSRRLRRDGIVLRQLRNAWILLRFRLGASPFLLAQEYESENTST